MIFPILLLGFHNILLSFRAKTQKRYDQRLLRAATIFVIAITMFRMIQVGDEHALLLQTIAFQLSFNMFAAIILSLFEAAYYHGSGAIAAGGRPFSGRSVVAKTPTVDLNSDIHSPLHSSLHSSLHSPLHSSLGHLFDVIYEAVALETAPPSA